MNNFLVFVCFIYLLFSLFMFIVHIPFSCAHYHKCLSDLYFKLSLLTLHLFLTLLSILGRSMEMEDSWSTGNSS